MYKRYVKQLRAANITYSVKIAKLQKPLLFGVGSGFILNNQKTKFMDDWFHSILEYLYKFSFDDTQIDITNFLKDDLKIPEGDVVKSGQARNVLTNLQKKNLIEWGYKSIPLGAEPFGDSSLLNPPIRTSVLKYHNVYAKLTLDGYKYTSERLRLKQQDKILATQTNLTKAIVGLTAVLAITGTIALFKSDPKPSIQLLLQMQDSTKKRYNISTYQTSTDSSRRTKETSDSSKTK